MLDIQTIRNDPQAVRDAARLKRIDAPIDRLLEVDSERRALRTEVEAARAEKNRASKRLRQLGDDQRRAAIAEMKRTAERDKTNGARLAELDAQYRELALQIPNLTDPDVPDGAGDTDNVELRTWGERPRFDFPVRDHIEIGRLLDIIDIPRGVKLAGARNYFLKGDGARLHLAVLRLAMDFIVEHGFTPFVVPHLVRDEAMYGTGYYPGGEEQTYRCDKDGANLIGTSEVPVTSYHSDEILEEADLPLRYAGHSSCYRREAGAAGKDTRGLYRVHQFDKVEQVIVTRADADESTRAHDEITANAEELLRSLGLPYRVVLVCGGDLGQGQRKKYDIESWMPSRAAYCETHSSSKFHDFQARRLMLRYRDAAGRTRYCHTLNNTLVASPRMLIPLLENNQEPDGSVRIPEVLQPYLGKDRIVRQ